MNYRLCILSVLGLSSPLLAQCPTGTPPVQLPVYGYSGNAVGSSIMAVDGDVAVTDYVWPNGGYPMPFFQIHRRTATGWVQRNAIGTGRKLGALAVDHHAMAMWHPVERYYGTAYPAGVRVMAEIDDPNSWSLTGSIFAETADETQFGRGLTLGSAGTSQYLVFGTVRPEGAAELVYVYTLGADGVPALAQTISDPDPSPDHAFGRTIAIADGTLAIGALGDDDAGPNAGAIYIFRLGLSGWAITQKLTPASTLVSTHLGQSLSLHDGRLAAGAVRSSGVVGDVPNSISFNDGFVCVYAQIAGVFSLETRLTNPNSAAIDRSAFGHSVAMRGDRLVIGAPQDSFSGTSAGAAYLFHRTNGNWQPRGALALPNSVGSWFGTMVGLADDDVLANGPLYNQGHLAAAVFDRCALPAMPGESPRCVPGLAGLVSYILNWFQLDHTADFDADGRVTANDLFQFMNAWFAGCP